MVERRPSSSQQSPRSDRMIEFKMRFFISNAVFLYFLLDAVAEKSQQDEWNDLLSWFRQEKMKKNQVDWELQDEDGGAVEDETFGSNRVLNPEEEWDRLVNGQEIAEDTQLLPEEGLDGEKPVRGASLAFVFDSTGSMRDELDQVKAGAKQILAALRDHPDAPIYNYIWVPFNDPEIGPVTVTTDHKLFQERMQDIMVFGGGDCPEMSIGAIKKALEVGLPNSYVYVFTDASAKDHRLTNEVLSLVQRKQAQVVFILTDDCKGLDEPNYKAYERIAETSSGQIYRLSKSEVKEVLKYVKVALQPHVVSLVSLNKPAPDKTNPDKVEVLIDESLKQFTVSVSGLNATVNVTDPKGMNIDGPPKLENVLNLKNIKVVNVKEPDPGSWSVFINSDSNYTVRSTGLSKINFNHGFSTVETVNLKETNYRPLKGAKSFILIQTSDTEKVYNLTSVDFVNLSGDVIQRSELTPVTGIPGLYKGGSFVPPPEFFYLGVSGFGQDGLPIKRITSTAVSGQLPEKPIITMRSKAVGRVNNRATLKCFIESVVPFTVRWYKNGVLTKNEQNCSETCEALLHIEKLTLQSEGTYSCSAKNVAGSDSKSLILTILEDAPTVKVNSPVVVSLGEKVHLDCLVESKIPYTVKWTQFTVKSHHRGVLHQSSIGRKLENNSLMIESAKPEDEGWYVCVAANKGGESQGRVLLIIKEPLNVKVEPSSITFAEGDSARFSCSASGKPQPRLEWLKDQQPIKDGEPSIFIDEINGKLNLMIDYLEKRNAGIYTCSAVNSEASASAFGELIYTEKPTVKAKENNLMVKAGSDVVLQCNATGYPKPVITWYKGHDEVSSNPRFQVNDGSLTIQSAQSADDGEYSCVAKNNRGTDIDYIGLIVGSAPTFLQKPRDKKIQINHNGTVACSAIGVPQPEIKWRRSDGQQLDDSRMLILSSGALKVTRMKVEDAGRYLCTAENVFGTVRNEVSIKVTGIEKPVLDKNMELRNVEAISGSELTIPCGIMLGNPPAKVKWFKNDVELKPNDQISIEYSGNLVIQNATGGDRGSYLCLAENAAGNSSRSYDVVISESPKIKDTNETRLKGMVGGEIIIPCPVEGFPPPSVTWTRNGLPLPMSSTIFQDESGSLIIRNLNEENAGVYVCTAINAVGSTSKTTLIHVQVPPTFPNDVQDSLISVVEGHVVVLNCNVSAIPEPTIKWFKNEELFPQDGEQTQILRFVANMDDTGIFKCIAENEAGTSSKEFNVTILVPPKILARNNEESIKAKAGIPITLLCNVFGVPTPTILWQRNGMYLTQNTSDITISDSGSLTIQNVTKESAGAYTCDAENPGGITQRNFYLQVNYPPKILEENATRTITLMEGEEYSLTCLVEGNPKPNVIWRKNGLPILGQQYDLIVLDDNTLVFLQVSRETTGLYKCEAINPEGSTFKEYEIKVLIPPSLTSDFYPTRLEVNEGDSLALICPTSDSIPPPNIQWVKVCCQIYWSNPELDYPITATGENYTPAICTNSQDGEPLEILLHERSDEAQMKLSLDQRTLTIVEAHPSDRGNYSCVATNLAGRTDARFLVDVLMTPHFEEFNHVAHRTILTGGEVVLNCSVTGNPQPKVSWRKESTPISPHNTPGVHVSLDKQHLVIANGRIHHTGTYICLAANKVNTKEREFYVTVLEPPQISGPLQQMIDVMKGDNVTLDCQGSGVPPPTFNWTKENETKKSLNVTEPFLRIINATCEDSGIYLCDITNSAGTRTKYFELSVLEVPEAENQERIDDIIGVVGGNITMKCKMSGNPKPEIVWLHNGHILHKVKKRSIQEDRYLSEWEFTDDGYVSLTLTNVQERNSGIYTLLASNKAGVVEKKFNVQILVPPRLLDGYEEKEHVRVVYPFPIVLKCPVKGEPMPGILWYKENTNGELLEGNENILLNGPELRIKKASSIHAGVFVCVAENRGGQVAHYFNVSVIEPPIVSENHPKSLSLPVSGNLTLYCNTTEDGEFKRSWFHSSMLVHNSTKIIITHSGRILEIRNVQPMDSGVYACLISNIAGSAEVRYHIQVHEPPAPSDHMSTEHHKVVQLHHPFSLYCFFTGYPPPEIIWFKNGGLFDSNQYENVIQLDSSYLSFTASEPKDAGDYKCVAKNSAGVQEMHFKVDVVVPGEWTSWSAWSECSVTCGFGEQVRQRSCNVDSTNLDPRVTTDKTWCKGIDIDRKKCFKECQVNDNWRSWSAWTPCSVTCGSGIRRRYRICNSKHENGIECKENDSQEETCFSVECPVNGQWSEWSKWSECSDPCGGGVMQRVRKCNSPSPQYGGEECPGWGSELKICNRHKCQDSGRWLPWTEWSQCSKTCGRGYRRRYRNCRTTARENTCKGENLQFEKCFLNNCLDAGFPSAANLYVRGKLNGIPVDNRVDISIENLENESQISGSMNDIIRRKGKWLPYAPFLLPPLSWNSAYETDNADNGYSLTDGNYFSQSDILFTTGEELKVKHRGDGVDKNGTFIVEIEVLGEVPLVEPHATVIVQPVDQDYIQTNANSLYSSTMSNMTVQGTVVPFYWNSSIRYDKAKGTMPYLVEKLSMKNISYEYNPETQNINFKASSTIGKKFENNQCPPGFIHDPNYTHCQDLNECETAENLCKHDQVCENTFGSYKCICGRGFRLTDRGCMDIDECSTKRLCSHACHNTLGSYRCSCPFGFYLAQDKRTCIEMSKTPDDIFYEEDTDLMFRTNLTSWDKYDNYDRLQEYRGIQGMSCPPGFFYLKNQCKDYNECEDDPNICDRDETCINFPGSYQCLSIPCPAGYQRKPTKNCLKHCNEKKCQRGATIAESIIFRTVNLKSNKPVLINLDGFEENPCNVTNTSFRVTESNEIFQIGVNNGKGTLYAIKHLNKDTLYRVKVEAFSYAANDAVLYFTEFIIFVVIS